MPRRTKLPLRAKPSVCPERTLRTQMETSLKHGSVGSCATFKAELNNLKRAVKKFPCDAHLLKRVPFALDEVKTHFRQFYIIPKMLLRPLEKSVFQVC